MKEIKLMKLTLKNFKGIKDFAIDVNGNDARIYGENGAGKTSIYDAFLWLLFNKNSKNITKFTVKTLTEEGEEINNLEHEVEARFLVDGVELTLKKVHFEDWAKAKNSPEKTFKGNKNKYFIDEVPTPEGQYKKMVDGLINEEVFKLLTSPTYFNEQLKWEKRRSTLLEITGDLSDQDVIAANDKLKELTGVLKGRKIEDHKLVIAAKKKLINDEIKSIPIGIKEIYNLLPKEEIDVPSIEKEIAIVEKKLDANATQINNIKNGSAITAKQQELHWIEIDLKDIQNELEAESIEKGHQVNAKIQEEQSNIANLTRKKEDAEHQLRTCEIDVTGFDDKLIELREKWAIENERVHEHSVDGHCPTCKQSLPIEEVEEAHEKALAAFNLARAKGLENINAYGKSITEDKTQTLEKIEKLKETATSLQSQIDSKNKVVTRLTTEVEALRAAIKDARQDERYTDKVSGKEKIEENIKTLQENAQSAVSDIEKEVTELRTKRTVLNTQIAQRDTAIASKSRIAELEIRQAELAKQFEEVEKELFLIEEFTRSKVELLDEKINSKFELARFKLLHKQVDGSLKDVCETTFNGVPYNTDLNDGAKIRVGLDIIQTLSEHYGFRVPIFIDNAESITGLINTDSQLISLVASEKDKQLRIEKQIVEEDGAA